MLKSSLIYIVLIFVIISCESPSSDNYGKDVTQILQNLFKKLREKDKVTAQILNTVDDGQYRKSNFLNALQNSFYDSLDKNDLAFILTLETDVEIQEALKPQFYWKMSDEDPPKYARLLLKTMEGDDVYEAKTLRYALLMSEKHREAYDILIDEVIAFSKRKANETHSSDRIYQAYISTWFKFIISQAYYIKSLNEPQAELQYLSLAFKNRLTVIDERWFGFLKYDTMLFEEVFQPEIYLKQLEVKNKSDKLTNIMLEYTFEKPSIHHMERLKHYLQTNSLEGLKRWEVYVKSKMSNLNDSQINYIFKNLINSRESKRWLLIDFWGTWCAPCLDDLPLVQTLSKKSENNSFLVRTVAVLDNKAKLKGFMEDKRYDFHALADPEKISPQIFQINEYPVKILVDLQSKKYIKIPRGSVSFKDYLSSYSLTNISS